MTASVLSSPQLLSPAWWTQRLHAELRSRQEYGAYMQRYADGDHDNPTVEKRSTAAFMELLGLSKTNLTGLIIEATAERLGIQGFRVGDEPDGDAKAWEIWQRSDFDSESELAITAALTVGRSFILVEPPQSDGDLPRLYAEDAAQMIVAYAPGRRQDRLAALKVWVDEWTGAQHATLYLPDFIYKLRQTRPGYASSVGWELRDGDVQVEPNPLGVVPVFELMNRPSLKVGSVKSEVHDVIRDQDAINKMQLQISIVMESGAFPQKWATGLEVPRDPTTGEPVEPFEVAVTRILISEDEHTRFGDFTATDLMPYLAVVESRVERMAAVSRTPVGFLRPQSNVSAEAMALGVSGMVQKVRQRRRHLEQPVEQAMRLGLWMIGDARAYTSSAEVLWVDADIKSDAQSADAAVKLAGGPVITAETAQEKYLGMNETERARDRAWREEGDAMTLLDRILPNASGDTNVPQ